MKDKGKLKKASRVKSFFAGLADKLDKKMVEKAKANKCCCCGNDNPKEE